MGEKKRFTQLLPESIEDYFRNLRRGTEHLDYGRDIIVLMAKKYFLHNDFDEFKLLDIGAGGGTDLRNIQEKLFNYNMSLYGIDSYKPNTKKLRKIGISAYQANIERDNLPFEDNYFDIVIANQVVEHAKDIFFIFSEISRILKKEGVVIVGIPNLAAFHNRILLFLGEQPACIRMPGPHVRGITKGAFCQFITTDDYFKVDLIKGANFFPFPPAIAKFAASIFPSMSTALFFSCKRTQREGNFIDVLKTRFYETNFFTGAP